MSGRYDERMIGRHLVREIFHAKLVVVPNCSWPGNECDLLAVTMDLRIVDVEIKISRADFKADAGKDKWWHRRPWYQGAYPERERRLWPAKVWKHYYCMPADIWKADLEQFAGSPNSGILLVETYKRGHTEAMRVKVERRAKPQKDVTRLTAEQVVDLARLANLRMWDAYDETRRAYSDYQKYIDSTRLKVTAETAMTSTTKGRV